LAIVLAMQLRGNILVPEFRLLKIILLLGNLQRKGLIDTTLDVDFR